MSELRLIPSIESLLQRPALADAARRHGRTRVTTAARGAADDLRGRLQARDTGLPATDVDAGQWLEREILDRLAREIAPSLTRVINATGVILHTNLGRAPLAAEALERAAHVAAGYANLEYDVADGHRGHRHVHAERLLTALTGAEAAVVVNNNAAATLLVLAAIAAGRDVLVSRGELVEIGGGFRVPDVMAQSGAVLREVGTTNRTRLNDYAAAIGERTALILRVHPSNFRIEGFTERPPLAELAALAHRFNLPLFEDLGSGWLGSTDEPMPALADEPSMRESIAAGVDLVSASGDKLLGGPQAGLIVGRGALVDRVRRHPLMRALRVDKLTYAALEATLALWAQAPATRTALPVHRMLTMGAAEIERRALGLVEALATVAGLTCRIVDGVSTTGGGSAPGSALPTKLVALGVTGCSAAEVERRLRAQVPPVIARIQDDEVVLDLRTVLIGEEADLARAVRSAAQKIDDTESAASASRLPGSTPR
ncbi:MAG: L-seryl-tRNA(Sec) selenium transferase [Vicinamibacterales bacterium]